MEFTQHTVASLANLEWRLGSSLVGKMAGELGINRREYYKSRSKKAQKRKDHNKAQIKGYCASLGREIEAALYGIPDNENFIVAVDTTFDVTKTGYIKRFKAYSFNLHPPAVSSNGKIAARKKNRLTVIVGPTARDVLEGMVAQSAKEFGLKTRYYADRQSLPLELQRLVDRETGTIIADRFYPLTTEKNGRHQLTFRSQKDMRKAIMRALEPDFDLIDDSWECSFTEMNTIQRSVSTMTEWGVSKLEKTKELDRKLASVKRRFRKAGSHLKTEGLKEAKGKLDAVHTVFEDIDREYTQAKSEWEAAEKLRTKKPEMYLQIKSDCIRRIERCGHRLEAEVVKNLEDILRTDPKISKVGRIKDELNRFGSMVDWGQRVAFLLNLITLAR